MKTLFFNAIMALTLLGASSAQATIDFMDKVYLVVGIQELKVEAFPFVNCAGIPILTMRETFTNEFKVLQTGCGSEPTYQNVNLLSCSKVTFTNEEALLRGDDYEAEGLVLDLKACKGAAEGWKVDDSFVELAKKAAHKTFKVPEAKVQVLR